MQLRDVDAGAVGQAVAAVRERDRAGWVGVFCVFEQRGDLEQVGSDGRDAVGQQHFAAAPEGMWIEALLGGAAQPPDEHPALPVAEDGAVPTSDGTSAPAAEGAATVRNGDRPLLSNGVCASANGVRGGHG